MITLSTVRAGDVLTNCGIEYGNFFNWPSRNKISSPFWGSGKNVNPCWTLEPVFTTGSKKF